MSLKFFTDASYSPEMKVGVVVTLETVDGIEMEPIVTVHNNVKNSQLEKIGIERCIEIGINKTDGQFTIYTDCESSIKFYNNDLINIKWIKGHKSKSSRISFEDLTFRKVDLLARKNLRQIVKDFF